LLSAATEFFLVPGLRRDDGLRVWRDDDEGRGGKRGLSTACRAVQVKDG